MRSSAALRSIPGLGFLQSHPASGGWGQYFVPSRTDSLAGDKADEPFVNRSSFVHGDQPAPDPGLVADHDEAQVRGGQEPQGCGRSVHRAGPVADRVGKPTSSIRVPVAIRKTAARVRLTNRDCSTFVSRIRVVEGTVQQRQELHPPAVGLDGGALGHGLAGRRGDSRRPCNEHRAAAAR